MDFQRVNVPLQGSLGCNFRSLIKPLQGNKEHAQNISSGSR